LTVAVHAPAPKSLQIWSKWNQDGEVVLFVKKADAVEPFGASSNSISQPANPNQLC
jgi:hypothetical protein